jgi:hypothetical protein
MANRIHSWFDIPSKFGFSGKLDAQLHGHQDQSFGGGVEAKAGPLNRPAPEEVQQVTSISHLIQLFDKALIAKKTSEILDFYTHGGPGSIHLGNDSLGPDELKQFQNKGFEQLFNPNATRAFLGCNSPTGHRANYSSSPLRSKK